jgi:hypothetical protein
MDAPLFLSLDEVLQLHASRIERYGGIAGVRDEALLKSAFSRVLRCELNVSRVVERHGNLVNSVTLIQPCLNHLVYLVTSGAERRNDNAVFVA